MTATAEKFKAALMEKETKDVKDGMHLEMIVGFLGALPAESMVSINGGGEDAFRTMIAITSETIVEATCVIAGMSKEFKALCGIRGKAYEVYELLSDIRTALNSAVVRK